LADKKIPGVQIKEKQKDEYKEAQGQNTWFAREQQKFPVPATLSGLRKLRLQASEKRLDLHDKLQQALTHEVETGLGFNLVPVFMGIGIAVYFAIPVEPSMIALCLSVAMLSLALWRLRTLSVLSSSMFALNAVFAGMLLAQAGTYYHQTPILERQITTQLEATVLAVDRSSRSAPRYLVAPSRLGDLPAEKIPRRIRLSAAAKHETIEQGDGIKGLARLQPVSGPVYPGGYDFSFFSWHQGMGGNGFFMGKPARTEAQPNLGIKEKLIVEINLMRLAIEGRVLSAMPDTTGRIAVALVTGNKTYIPNDVQESLRKTGLAHILAISGLHMALVTLTVIWLVRSALLLVPTMALKYPIKKWAVCAGFVSATTYLMLSGAGVATQRAWVMISVMLLAVLMDRRAITMRSVAISAIIILIINPQSLLSPGFQMSFAAVTALVAGYEILNNRRRMKAENNFSNKSQHRFENSFANVGRNIAIYLGGIATTSLIAGTATAFIAAWHFHQVAVFGLLANLLAMPIVSLVIMPFVLFSMVLMPYGLEFIPLFSVSYGIDWVLDISRWVEEISPNGNTGLLPRSSILVFSLFLIVMCFMKTRLRVLGLAPLAFLPFFLEEPRMPDVIVAENGRAVGVKTQSGSFGLLYPRGSKFVQGIWLKAWAGEKAEPLGLSKEQCNRERCIYVLPQSKVLHVVYNPELLTSSCNRADILVAPRLWWVNCRKRVPETILSRYDFERFGTHALYINKVTTNAISEPVKTNSEPLLTQVEIQTSLPEATRPWHRQIPHPDSISGIGG